MTAAEWEWVSRAAQAAERRPDPAQLELLAGLSSRRSEAMGVNEGTILDNQVRCSAGCDTVMDRQVANGCALCDALLCEACWPDHALAEFVEWLKPTRPHWYYDDAVFKVLNHDALPRLIVREPHREGGSGDDGQGTSYCDEGWYWEGGAKLTKAERDEIEDVVHDLVYDAVLEAER